MTWWHSDFSLLIRRPDVSWNALNFTVVLLLPIHRSQQSRRGRLWNVFPRFGRRWSYNNWPRDIANPPQLLTGVKKCEIWRNFPRKSILSHLRLRMQQDIWTLKQLCNARMIALCPFQVWWSSVYASQRSVRRNCPTPKIGRRKCAKSSITLPRIVGFCSRRQIVPQKLKVKGSKVKIDVTGTKICQIMNNWDVKGGLFDFAQI